MGAVGGSKLLGGALTPGGVGGAFTPPCNKCCSDTGGALKSTGAVIDRAHAVSSRSLQAHERTRRLFEQKEKHNLQSHISNSYLLLMDDVHALKILSLDMFF